MSYYQKKKQKKKPTHTWITIIVYNYIDAQRGRRGGDRIGVWSTTTCIISAYHH